MKYFFLFMALLNLPSFASTTICWPSIHAKLKGGFGIVDEGNGKTSLILAREWKLDEGTLPVGPYEGTIKKLNDGFSYIAKFNVQDAIPNDLPNAKDTNLTIRLSAKSDSFNTELYLLFPTDDSEIAGSLLGYYGCQRYKN